MNKLRLFLVAISAALTINAWACGPVDSYEDTHLFVMRMPIRQAIADQNRARQEADAETLNFWYTYTKGAISKEDLSKAIKELEYETFLNNALNDNALTAYLQRRQDKTALNYLRYNSEIVYGSGGNEWDYREPYTAGKWKALQVRIAALSSTNAKMAERIQFLKLRCLFKLNRYEDCINMWKTSLSKVTDKSLLNRVEGYVGGAYFWTNRFTEAIDIFQKQGDIQSINTAVNKMISATSKETLYAHDPNSIALEYAMQDYANYYYQYMRSMRDEQNVFDYSGDVWNTVVKDYDKTVAFAEKVLSEGKSKNPMFWAGFIGFMKWANGDADEAYKYLTKAQTMAGTSDMAYFVRLYKLMAGINMKSKPAGFDDYFISEYGFYLNKIKAAAKAYNDTEDGSDIVYTYSQEVTGAAFVKVITPEAISNYAPNGGLTQALLQGISDRYADGFYTEGMWCTYIHTLDNENTIDQDIQILKQYLAGGNGKVDKALISMAGDKVLSEDILNDIIGTKMLRDLRFDEAQQYLSKVSLDYLSKQGIAPYLINRRMPDVAFKRVNTDTYWENDGVKMTENVKLKFARNMVAKLKAMEGLSGDEKALALYDYANHLYQASLGDLWALTSYSWSSYDFTSELTPKVIELLMDADINATSMDIKKMAWFAEASIPAGETGISLDWNSKTDKYTWNFSNMTMWQQLAMKNLAANVTPSDEMYHSCDILRAYIQRYK